MSVDLQPLHTFRLPSYCSRLIKVRSAQDLKELTLGNRFIVLAGGSNTIFLQDYEGLVIQPQIYGVEIKEQADAFLISAGATENWHEFVKLCLQHHIPGLENLALIPGTIGAAPVQNIGAYGVEIAEFIDSVQCLDLQSGQACSFNQTQCEFGYRDSIFKRNPDRWLITNVQFKLSKNWQPNLSYPALSGINSSSSAKQIFEHVISIRQSKLPDPDTVPNAGSFFKNPLVTAKKLTELQKLWPDIVYFETPLGIKLAAAWIIDRLGLKGTQVGGAAVHRRQALVLINREQATGDDVFNLCQKLQAEVKAATGLQLEPEVRLIGRHGILKELYRA